MRRHTVRVALVETLSLWRASHAIFCLCAEVITAAAPIIEYFGGNHSACLKLLEAEEAQNAAITFKTMSHTERVMYLNEALEAPDVGELPSKEAAAQYDALHLRPKDNRPLSQPTGRNLNFRRMFSKGLMVLRGERLDSAGSDSNPRELALAGAVRAFDGGAGGGYDVSGGGTFGGAGSDGRSDSDGGGSSGSEEADRDHVVMYHAPPSVSSGSVSSGESVLGPNGSRGRRASDAGSSSSGSSGLSLYSTT